VVEPLANFKYDIESTTGWVGSLGEVVSRLQLAVVP